MITPYIKKQINEIVAWEKEEPWLITKLYNKLTSPLAWGVRMILPKVALEGAISGADWLSSFTTTEGWIISDAGVNSLDEVQALPLEKQDALADSVHNWAIGLATTEGAVTGETGIVGMAIDIPAVITLAFRTIRQVGLCYGYTMQSDDDFRLALSIMDVSGAASMTEKSASLASLKSLEPTLKLTWKAMGKVATDNPASREAFLIALRALAKQLGVRLTNKKALQAIPIVGAGVGVASNLGFIRSVGWAARRTFQRKTLERQGHTIAIQT